VKAIYTSDNVKKTLLLVQKRYKNLYNRDYTIQQIIYAFNKLPGKYQDLLLKIKKDENDKANLVTVYDYFRKNLFNAKNVPSDIKIDIKNIKQEEEKKKEEVSLEDIESDNGDKWVRPVEKKEPKIIIEPHFPIKKKEEKLVIKHEKNIKKEEIPKEVKEIPKEVKEIPKEVKEIPKEVKEIPKEEIKADNNKELMNEKIKNVIMGEYLAERQNIDIESILDNVDLEEDEKFIILVKYENNSVKTNEEVSKELGITTSFIDEIVNRFLSMSIDLKKSKILTLERN